MGYDDEQDARVAADKISRLIVVIFFIVYSCTFALVILGLSGMLIIGYCIYKGTINIQKVVNRLEVTIEANS